MYSEKQKSKKEENLFLFLFTVLRKFKINISYISELTDVTAYETENLLPNRSASANRHCNYSLRNAATTSRQNN